MFELVRANQRRSLFVLALMLALFGGGGILLSEMFGGGPWPGLAIGGGVWLILVLVAFTAGDNVFLHMAHARRLEDRSYCPVLFNVVEEMSIAAGLPQPEIWLIRTSAPNAFATGRNPKKGKIAVTTGLLEIVTRDELQGVIAHEISHIKNRDTTYMTIAAITVAGIGILSEVIWRMMRVGILGRGNRQAGSAGAYILIAALVFAILGPLFARLLYLALSRRREYLADASGAILTRYPEGLASALEKIARSRTPFPYAHRSSAPLFIVNPLQSAGGLWSTHPPVEKRVAILRSLGKTVGWKEYEEAFRRAGGRGIAPRSAYSVQGIPVLQRAGGGEPVLARSREARARELEGAGYATLACECGAVARVPPGLSGFRCPFCGRSPEPVRGAVVCPSCERRTPRRFPRCLYCSGNLQ